MADVSIEFSGAADQGKDTDGPFRITNTAGWSAFAQWAATAGPALAELANAGHVTGTDRLAEDFGAANPPESLKGIAETLMEFVGVGDPDETAVVSDGADE